MSDEDIETMRAFLEARWGLPVVIVDDPLTRLQGWYFVLKDAS